MIKPLLSSSKPIWLPLTDTPSERPTVTVKASRLLQHTSMRQYLMGTRPRHLAGEPRRNTIHAALQVVEFLAHARDVFINRGLGQVPLLHSAFQNITAIGIPLHLRSSPCSGHCRSWHTAPSWASHERHCVAKPRVTQIIVSTQGWGRFQ